MTTPIRCVECGMLLSTPGRVFRCRKHVGEVGKELDFLRRWRAWAERVIAEVELTPYAMPASARKMLDEEPAP